MEKCIDCNKEIVSTGLGDTGYAIDSETNGKICYACCAKRDLKSVEDTEIGKVVPVGFYYKDTTYQTIENWPGTLKFPVDITYGKHNWSNCKQVFIRLKSGKKNFCRRAVSGPVSGDLIFMKRIKDDA